MSQIYIVEHSYELNGCDETKLVGIFSTLFKAQEIVEKYKSLPGFEDYQEDFFINKYEYNFTDWKEGFCTKKRYILEGVPLHNMDILNTSKILKNFYKTDFLPKGPGSEYEKLKEWKNNYE